MNKRMLINIVFFVVVLVSDQVTKMIAQAKLSEGVLIEVIPDLFNLTLVYNQGAAFGMFSTWPDALRRTVLTVVSFIALLVVVRFMFKEAKDDWLSQLALSGILAGAIGNIADRIRYDAVVDFLDFYWGSYHWPAFNIADSAISVGVTLLVVRIMFAGNKQDAVSDQNPVPDAAA